MSEMTARTRTREKGAWASRSIWSAMSLRKFFMVGPYFVTPNLSAYASSVNCQTVTL